MDINNITNIKSSKTNRKSYTHPFNPVFFFFFILLTKTSSEMFPGTQGLFFISESLALNWYIFVALTNKKLLLPL